MTITNKPQLRIDIRETGESIRALRAGYRRHVGTKLDGRTKTPIIKHGRNITPEEARELINLRARATMLLTVYGLCRGKVHCMKLIEPNKLRSVIETWSLYLVDLDIAVSQREVTKTGQVTRVA